MKDSHEETIRALIILLNDYLDNSEHEEASQVAKTLQRFIAHRNSNGENP